MLPITAILGRLSFMRLSYVLVSDWIDGWIRKERRKIERCRYVQNVEKELGL